MVIFLLAFGFPNTMQEQILELVSYKGIFCWNALITSSCTFKLSYSDFQYLASLWLFIKTINLLSKSVDSIYEVARHIAKNQFQEK